MLILTRRIGEVIMIGDDIKITILDKNFTRVRVGIEAPEEIVILREELYNKKNCDSGVNDNADDR